MTSSVRRIPPGWIAERRLVLVHPDGQRVACCTRVGTPYDVDEREFRCPVEIEGLHERFSDIAGESTVQALALAVQLVAMLLGSFVERGGRVLLAGSAGEPDAEVDPRDWLGVGIGRS